MKEDVIMRAIRELRERRAVIEQEIQLVEAVASGQPKRGRPPKILADWYRAKSESKNQLEKRGIVISS